MPDSEVQMSWARKEAVLKKYQDLKRSDQKLCLMSEKVFESIYGTVLNKCKKRLTGSARDGSVISRWFKKTDGPQRIHIEWDVEYYNLEIEQENYVIQEISNYPGYVRVHERSQDEEQPGPHIDGEVYRGNLFEKWSNIVTRHKKHIKRQFSNVFHERSGINDFQGLHGKEDYFFKKLPWTKPRVSLKMEGLSTLLDIEDKEQRVCFSCDNIAAIHCKDFWPRGAKDWTKNSSWSEEDFEELKRTGCCLVPKPSRHSDRTWRLSLSEVESKVMKRFTKQQYLAFFICKIVYYKYLAHLRDGESEIRSYIIKSAALNCFGVSNFQPTSSNFFEGVFQLVERLLDFTRQALKPELKDGIKPYMTHFLLKDVNILLNVTNDLGWEAAGVLQEIIDGGVVAFLPLEDEIDEAISMVNILGDRVNYLSSLKEHFNNISSRSYSCYTRKILMSMGQDVQNSSQLQSCKRQSLEQDIQEGVQPKHEDILQSYDSGYGSLLHENKGFENYDSYSDQENESDCFSDYTDLSSDYSDVDDDSDCSASFYDSEDDEYLSDSSFSDLSESGEFNSSFYNESTGNSTIDCGSSSTTSYTESVHSDLEISIGSNSDNSILDSNNNVKHLFKKLSYSNLSKRFKSKINLSKDTGYSKQSQTKPTRLKLSSFHKKAWWSHLFNHTK
ncbi:uncharacterized protein [Clytia hemisphaerica]|uniref:Mab-21-like nucleotidyltransferase domain-containing protein n=1 Tax=Clytia hemisphaerica TaxID=252671 RepID=A0A7M6DJC6_9CNID|eukprot:TCONS_00029655-protein